MKDFEVEVRGPLSKAKYDLLLDVLHKKGKFKLERRRLFIDYSTFLDGEGLSGRTKDIRVRQTNGEPEIVVKIGAWTGNESRRELIVPTKTGSFDTLVQVFAALGYTKGILGIRNSQVFQFQGAEFAVVEVPGHSYYFEAEIMGHKDETSEIEKRIRSICDGLGLTTFTPESFFAYIDDLNKSANEIFDFKAYSEGDFARRFEKEE